MANTKAVEPEFPQIDQSSGKQLSQERRVALGKAARTAAPRSDQGAWEALPDRPDPVALLESQAASRVPELVPIRYGRMAVSAFTFFRGAALIMASDLATTPRSGLTVQACGDAHLSNFGVFASAERSLVFDVNDFDETLPGPWEWDVKRLAASLAIAGRDRGFSEKERTGIVVDTACAYRTEMAKLATMRDLDVWYARLDADTALKELANLMAAGGGKKERKTTSKLKATADKELAKARTRDSMQALGKLTEVVNGETRFISNPPLIVPIAELVPESEAATMTERLYGLLSSYGRSLQSDRQHLLKQFRFAGIARKVVGVGSVGTRAWVVLMLGSDGVDPLLLQAKEAQESVLARFVGKSHYANEGERVVAGQHLMQASSDIFLGWDKVEGLDGVQRDFYIRQLRDWKGSAEVERMIPEGMAAYGRLCGWTLARAHARSGDRIAIAAYLGSGAAFDNAIASFAESYADQNEKDYQAMQAAIADGRIVAESGL
ncbi:MAG TPA: DUF2252 domain-containing protein [Acidimicrobiales bacterium]|jgi:uncharacterized protein (DUF2252 family)|nr:DUF2252 domain-containing protein [Acidimicrobiales bacterium]